MDKTCWFVATLRLAGAGKSTLKVGLSSWGYECPHMPGVRAGAGPVFRVFVIPSALVRSRWANHLNVACNSPEVRKRPGFTSLELQRFWVCLNVQSIELHATLLRSCPEAARLATIAEHIAPTPMALVSAPELPASQNISPITPMPAIIRRGSLHLWAPHPYRPPPYRWHGPTRQ